MRPVARVDKRSSMSAHDLALDLGPEPAACDRMSERWSCARRSTGMCRVARAPKPVDTP